jgi:NAD(P)-dependent dehydrogenase (short-subunit alcohol dehydrogenase family)
MLQNQPAPANAETEHLVLASNGVRVNAIAPGWFVTELNQEYLLSKAGAVIRRKIPAGRFEEDGDRDGPLLLLTSDAGRFIVGATIVVDGGQIIALEVSDEHLISARRQFDLLFQLALRGEQIE